ncbi:DUF72 domain-containing protein [Pontibacter akesuensis]|uniref:Uncharacterized conserved protein YecE, DUF72 family n=1 Tax=Pontibacter akesuensis TaxID=388950 RepID=A0A1I7KTR0_9BACT|nr:DUF72 domain-containing protein [Pontibacter akesuensis]GHA80614.1 hypothetical protein GCM10007389_38690 [Pontibacter akesuensis]SFV00892.1 Uncharacterized conserved protein YecE, DUF72 family [Pontibacter akesuensis]
MAAIPNLYIGTSGWSYRWQEVLYPPELKSAERLPFYATRFDATEINSSFYHFTMAKTIEKWLASTPEHFRFAPKLHQEVTHKQKFVDIEEPLDKFMSRYLLMGPRLGPVLVQIAASFRYNRLVAESFYRTLREKYPMQDFALEARHVSWFSEESLELLREYKITLVIASAGKRFAGTEATTTNTAYLRLHGDERLYSSAYSDEKLERYAYMIKDWLEDKKEVWVFFNNTIQGHAVTDADKLRGMVQHLK